MATTVNIPLTTLAPNQVVDHTTLPALDSSVPVGVTEYTLAVNRNVGTSSLDTTPSARLVIAVDYSLDGGTTWNPGLDPATTPHYSTSTINGGVIQLTNKQTGQLFTVEVSQETTGIPGDPTSSTRRVRASVTNGPATVSVSGSLTIG